MKKIFETEGEMLDALKEMDHTDVWSDAVIKDCKVSNIVGRTGLALPTAVAKAYGVALTPELGDGIDEALAPTGTGLMLEAYVGGEKFAAPVANAALATLGDRAGLYGPAVKKKPELLNYGFELRDAADETQLLVRRGMVLAAHSSRYCPLPQGELMEVNKAIFSDLFGDYEFLGGEYGDDVTYARYRFPERTSAMTLAYRKRATAAGEGGDIVPGVIFTTSDTQKSGANLHPTIEVGGTKIRSIGAMKIPHDRQNGVADYAGRAWDVHAMVQQGVERLTGLFDIPMLYPDNAFQNAVRRFDLPAAAASAAFEEWSLVRPAKCTAHTIYLGLCKVAEHYAAPSTVKALELDEKLARIMGCDWHALDTAVLQ